MTLIFFFFLAAGWLTLEGRRGWEDVQQHGQDCRCEKDRGAAEAGGQHREDDGESAFKAKINRCHL